LELLRPSMELPLTIEESFVSPIYLSEEGLSTPAYMIGKANSSSRMTSRGFWHSPGAIVILEVPSLCFW